MRILVSVYVQTHVLKQLTVCEIWSDKGRQVAWKIEQGHLTCPAPSHEESRYLKSSMRVAQQLPASWESRFKETTKKLKNNLFDV